MGNFGLRVLPVGQLETNCYLVFDRATLEGLIIDPGDDADYIMRIISDENIKPLKILATHGHFDHLLAATELKLAYNLPGKLHKPKAQYQIPLLIHKGDEFLVKRSQKSASHFLVTEKILPPPRIDGFLKEGQKIYFGNYYLEVLETPGHTPGSVCFCLKKEGIIFCGDTIFKDGPGRTDFSYSSREEIKRSLARIGRLPPQTIFYPGHGENFTNPQNKYILD